MKKLKYIVRCIFSMDFKKMFGTISGIAKEYHKPWIVIFFDMIWCAFRYGAGYIDYQIFMFAGLNSKQRATFVTRGINNDFIRRLNSREYYAHFSNKIKFNTLFGQYLKREWIYLEDTDWDGLKQFVAGKSTIIVKPVDAICGKGIEKIHLNGQEDIKALYDKFKSAGQLLIEECIEQHTEINKIYSGSVNTIRLVTIANGAEVHIVFRAMRIGAQGNVVDNFNSGGMFVLVDENGVISTPAINKKTVIYEEHPATGTRFEGFKIPYFEEAQQLVKMAAEVVPQMRYIGWDVAITPNGPVLVEGNHNPGHDILQSKVYLRDHSEGVLAVYQKAMEGM